MDADCGFVQPVCLLDHTIQTMIIYVTRYSLYNTVQILIYARVKEIFWSDPDNQFENSIERMDLNVDIVMSFSKC